MIRFLSITGDKVLYPWPHLDHEWRSYHGQDSRGQEYLVNIIIQQAMLDTYQREHERELADLGKGQSYKEGGMYGISQYNGRDHAQHELDQDNQDHYIQYN